MADKSKPPELPGYRWSTLTGSAPWDPESSTDQVVVGDSPCGIALYDRKTGIIHHWASAKPN
jgi:hypothetical protein